MIGYLKGRLLAVTEDGHWIVLPEGSGVGYTVTVPGSAEYSALNEGVQVELHIHTHVREDALDLFGFLSRTEKDVFLALTSVNGIGPKLASGILAGISVDDLVEAILTEDKGALVRVPGIGKKTAERVVLELADKIQKKVERGDLKRPTRGSGAHSSKNSRVVPATGGAKVATQLLLDAKSALVSLGYREAESEAILKEILKNRSEEVVNLKVEDLIRDSLKHLR
jgi:Holliday junction DNA helicase RuvA